jgi:hypothetical protein
MQQRKIRCILYPDASRTRHLIDVAMHTIREYADTVGLPSRGNRKWLFFLVLFTAVTTLTATVRLCPLVSHTSARLKFI